MQGRLVKVLFCVNNLVSLDKITRKIDDIDAIYLRDFLRML